MSPNRLCSCPCDLHIKPKMMLLRRQTEISLYLIKFNSAKYSLVPVYFQEFLQPDFKNSKVQLIMQNLPTFANLWDFPNTSLCWTVSGTSKETVQDTEALENSTQKSECLHKRNLKGKENGHFLPCIYHLAASLLIFFFIKTSFLLARTTSVPRSHSTFTLNTVQLAWLWQVWWTWFQWSSLLRVWSETPHFNNNVLPLNRKQCLGSEVFQQSCWQCDRKGSCDCPRSFKIRIMPCNCFIYGFSSLDLALKHKNVGFCCLLPFCFKWLIIISQMSSPEIWFAR